MSAIARRLFSNSIKLTHTFKRNIFSESAIGVESFRQAQESVFARNGDILNDTKKKLAIAITDKDTPIELFDLKLALYTSKTNEELDFFLQAFRKFLSVNEKPKFSFNAQIVRACYVLNNIDKAIGLLRDPTINAHIASATSLLMITNKLVAEKRYDDAFNFLIEMSKNENFIEPISKIPIISIDVLSIVIQGLLMKNTQDTCDKANAVIDLAKEANRILNREGSISAILIFLNHGKIEKAKETLSLIKNQTGGLALNLKAVILAREGKFDDSFIELQKVLSTPKNEYFAESSIFPYTLKQIREAADAANNKDAITKLETLAKTIYKTNRLNSLDLTDFVLRIKRNRIGANQNAQKNTIEQNQRYAAQGSQQQETGYLRTNRTERFEQGEQRLYRNRQSQEPQKYTRPLTPPPFGDKK